MKKGFIFFVLVSFLSTSSAYAEVILGSGFKCSGNTIFKGIREVTSTKAKSTLVQTIAKLKLKLAAAPKKKKAGIKAKIKEASQAKSLLKACSSGTLDNSQVDPIFTQLASGSGLYSGTYQGLVGGFIPISGSVSMLFQLQGTVLTGTLTLGGNLGNTLNAQPLAFQNDVGGIGFPAQFFLTNTFIGDVTLSITQAGHLSIVNSNFGSTNAGPIDFEGDFAGQTITSTLNGSYSGVSFAGGATLTRQP